MPLIKSIRVVLLTSTAQQSEIPVWPPKASAKHRTPTVKMTLALYR